MKVFLVLYLCSSVANTCLNPIIIPDPFEDDYTCLLDGYNKSYEKLVEIGKHDVNTSGIYIKFDCKEIVVPLPKPKVKT